MAYDNEKRGVLFKNDKKNEPGGNPLWPDYKGTIQLNGKEYEIAAWIKTSSKNDRKFLSLQIQDPKDRPARQSPPPAVEPEPDDSGVPF